MTRLLRPAMFPCPNCSSDLSRAQNQLGVYWYCPRCTGRAVNLAVLRKAVAPEFVTGIWRTAHTSAGKPGRPCPSCGLAMLEVPAPSAEATLRLDVCKRCQFVWFDPRELEAAPPAPARPAEPVPGTDLPQAAHEALALCEVKRLADQAQYDDDELTLDWKTLPGIFGLPVEADENALQRVPWLTWGLAAALLLTGLATLFAIENPAAIIEEFAFVPAHPFRLAGLTFVSSFFLHGGLLHLFGNVYFLLVFGDNVEDYLGRARFVLLLLAATVTGHVFHLLGDPRSDIPCIGASGGISGLIAFYALKFPHARLSVLLRVGFRPIRWIYFPAWVGFCAWVMIQCLGALQQTAGVTNVSALAHLGGATVGLLLWLKWRNC